MTQRDSPDGSNGYESVANRFISCRSQSSVGVEVVREWVKDLPRSAAILDLGCGNGKPISQIFIDEGFAVYGVDASVSMITSFRARFPRTQTECSLAEESGFFDRTFAGVVAWGLIFLLTPELQSHLIRKVSRALDVGGRFLFTAPQQACEWSDALTDRKSVSLGVEAYRRILVAEGLAFVGERQDKGENHYYLTMKETHQHRQPGPR